MRAETPADSDCVRFDVVLVNMPAFLSECGVKMKAAREAEFFLSQL